jgi:hypothetical protein
MATNWTSLAVTGAGLWDQLDRYDDLNKYTQEELGNLSNQAVEGSRFTPFGVAGYGGGATVGAGGNVNVNLDPSMQAQSEMLTGQANQFFQDASMDQGGRQQSIYDAIRQMQMPEEERAMMGLESRAFAQGRLGVQSDLYGGGSPEMLAMQKAIGENRNAASVSAIEQARAQQMQDANIGTQFQSNAYMPQAQTMNLLNQGFQGAQLNQAGQLGGLNLATQLGLGGVQTQVNSEKIRAELMSKLFGTIGNSFNDTTSDPLGDLFRRLF